MTEAVKCDICGVFEDHNSSTGHDFTLDEVDGYSRVYVCDMCEGCRQKLHELYRAEVKQ